MIPQTAAQRINALLTIGYISGASGVNGWVRVKSITEEKGDILTYSPWQLLLGGSLGNGEQRQCNVLDATIHPRYIAVQLDCCHDRDQAIELSGSEIAISRQRLPRLQPGDYYWADLIGLQVITVHGVVLGDVDKLIRTGANDVLVVQAEQQHLIPYIPDQVLKEIDPARGIIVVDWEEAGTPDH